MQKQWLLGVCLSVGLASCISDLLQDDVDDCPEGTSNEECHEYFSDPCRLMCSGETPVCEESTGECVECLQSSQCTNAKASACDTDDNVCALCEANADCEHISGQPYCSPSGQGCVPCNCTDSEKQVCDLESEQCVECTIETEAEQCGENSCNPATHECTDTARSSADICEPCVADSECEDEGAYCVPMRFSPEGEDVTELGGYCLKEVPEDLVCPRPFSSSLARTTLSSIAGKMFCGVAEALTTCTAVLALLKEEGPQTCTSANDCGIAGLDDGLCESIPGAGLQVCTYACDSASQCPTDKPCPGGGGYCGQP